MSRILGIDPGINGAWAVVDELGAILSAAALPTTGEGKQAMVSGAHLVALFQHWQPAKAAVERVGSMPGQGLSSTFRFGRAVGIIEGVIASLGIPIVYVAPGVWKKHFKLAGPDKEPSRQRAIETWPKAATLYFNRKKDHGVAEAALIALWGQRAAVAGRAA